MKLSISYYSLHNKVGDTFDFIEFCNKNGVKCVELLDYHLNKKEDIEKVNNRLKELNMEVSSYSIGNDFIHVDENERKKEIEIMKEKIDTALTLNTKIVRVFSGNGKEGVEFDTAKQWIVDCFKEVCPYAEQKGVTLVIENHGLFVGKSSQVKELIENVNSKALRANVDTGNFLLAGENSLEAVKNLENYISFVHFKDFIENDKDGYKSLDGKMYKGTAIGSGQVPLKDIVEFLKKIGYTGYLSIEYEESGNDVVEDNIQSIKFVKELL